MISPADQLLLQDSTTASQVPVCSAVAVDCCAEEQPPEMNRAHGDGPGGDGKVCIPSPPPQTLKTSKLLKYVSLITLVVQTTSLILFLRVSRTAVGTKYLSSTVVAMTEILKVLICIVVMLAQSRCNFLEVLRTMHAEIWLKPAETLKLIVPAALYTVQNNLLFLALSHLDAATYQVTYQLKILTTALFSITMLGKRIAVHQWVALFVLTGGVALVQLATGTGGKTKNTEGNAVIGLTAVILACVSSGFSGVYFEKLLKGSKTTLWIRNIQLGGFSIVLGFAGVLISDFNAVQEHGFFQGYNLLTVVVILFHGVGGIIVALTIRYADNILKCFAGAASIILSCVVSYLFLGDFTPTFTFVAGTALVTIATFLYGYEKPQPQYVLKP